MAEIFALSNHARESGAPCQSAQSVCDWAADSLTRQADGIIRKLPQMLNSIHIQQAQELQDCKHALSQERFNHSTTQQVGTVADRVHNMCWPNSCQAVCMYGVLHLQPGAQPQLLGSLLVHAHSALPYCVV
jgi:hypothetical protein